MGKGNALLGTLLIKSPTSIARRMTKTAGETVESYGQKGGGGQVRARRKN